MAGFGFDITEGAKGAEAMTDILAQPAVLEQKKAEASSATSKAIEEKAKAGYEVSKYAALDKYMKGSPAKELGTASYGLLNDTQELSQEKAKLKQEEARAEGLPPEERAKLDAHFDRQQRMIDKKEQAVLTKASQHMDTAAAIYSNINSAESLEQARPFLREVKEAEADAAVAAGKIPPDQKENYVNDSMKKALPEKWDDNSPQFLGTKLDAMKSFKEQTADRLAQVKEQHEENYRTKTLEQQKTANKNVERQINSQNLGYLRAESASIDATAKDSARMLQEYSGVDAKLATEEKNIRASQVAIQKILQGSASAPPIPKEIVTKHMFGADTKEPNPRYVDLMEGTADTPGFNALADDLADIKKKREDLTPKITDAETTHKQAVTNADTVRSMMGFKPLPKQDVTPKPPPPAGKAEPASKDIETSAKAAWGSYEPTKYEYRVSPEGKIQRKAK